MTPIEVARLYGPGDVRVGREDPAEPRPGDAIVRVRAVGLCGSDLHWFDEGSIGDARISRPLVLGHEFAGEIAEGPRAGERVVGDPANACGDCAPCRAGWVNLCLRMRFAGHGEVDGALRTLMPWPADLLLPIPASIEDGEAPLLEPAAIAVHALALASPLPSSAGVFGCGPIGLLIVQLLLRSGVPRVVATDVLPHRVAAAAALGATAFQVDAPGPADPSGGRAPDLPEVDVAFEAGGTDAALHDALTSVAPGGRVILVGIPPGDRTSFRASLARRKGLTLVLCRRSRPEDLREAIRLGSSRELALDGLITHRFPLSDAAAAFAVAARRDGLKVVVQP